jgi:hypothetical protein
MEKPVKRPAVLTVMLAMALGVVSAATADVITIPKAALIASTQYYTSDIGGGIGSALIMTGGGNAANVGSSRNDDGFSGPIALGFSLNFFGNTYTEFYANNNGNISFGNGISAYTPAGPQGAPQPIISPFFADVDTRHPSSGVMYLRNDIANEIIITWDDVGFYNTHGSPTNSFQLVLRGDDYDVPEGEGQIGFFWNSMGWETGDASGGFGGFGGTPGAVGFGDGASNGFVLQGSIQPGISGVVASRRLWVNLSDTGVPVVPGVPEPGTVSLLAVGLAAAAAKLRHRSNS